jgi:hypothetical protein
MPPFPAVPLPVTPTPAPATIPISFIAAVSAQAVQMVGDVSLPLPPLPGAVGARVSIQSGAYPTDYDTAGSNMLSASFLYNTIQLGLVYAPALATLLASAAYAAYVAAGETGPAFDVLFATSDYQTWLGAYDLAYVEYTTYVSTYTSAQSALNWWQTYARAVNFFNANPLLSNPYSGVNEI